jgi:hypothetical protein
MSAPTPDVQPDTAPGPPDTAAGSSSGRIRTLWNALVAGMAVVMWILPHVLHHIGLLAGTSLIAGAGGTVLFGLIGLAAFVPLLIKLYRRFGTWLAPAVALVVHPHVRGLGVRHRTGDQRHRQHHTHTFSRTRHDTRDRADDRPRGTPPINGMMIMVAPRPALRCGGLGHAGFHGSTKSPPVMVTPPEPGVTGALQVDRRLGPTSAPLASTLPATGCEPDPCHLPPSSDLHASNGHCFTHGPQAER